MKQKLVTIATIFTESYLFCLPHFFNYINSETYKNIKVLVLANNCKLDLIDDLKQVQLKVPYEVIDMGSDFANVSSIIVESRKTAVSKAAETNSYLFFIDIDTVPNGPSIENLMSYFERGDKIGMVGGNYHFRMGMNLLIDLEGRKSISFPVVRFELKDKWDVQETSWTDKAAGLGFGFTIINPKVFEFLKLSTDYGRFGTEDYPACERVIESGYKIIWVRDVRAKHIAWNKVVGRIEAY